MEFYNFSVSTVKRTELIDITKNVENYVLKNSKQEGLCEFDGPRQRNINLIFV